MSIELDYIPVSNDDPTVPPPDPPPPNGDE